MEKHILKADERKRLDLFLSQKLDYTRSYLQKLIKEDCVRVNGEIVKVSHMLAEDDLIELQVKEPVTLAIPKEDKPLEIVYQDKYLAIVNKRAGVVVHPVGRQRENTLVNRLLFHLDDLSAIGGVIRPGIVHRLDKDTSGLLVVAKTNEAHLKLSALLKEHKIERNYIALLKGNLEDKKGVINLPIGRRNKNEIKMGISPSGRYAVTHYRVIEEIGPYTLVAVGLETGRTHQIRVHFAYLGHPVAGDSLYGGKMGADISLTRHFLHAYEISFFHPIMERKIMAHAMLPEELRNTLKELRNKWKKKR